MNEDSNDINFFVLQLAQSLELSNVQKWTAEIARVISQMGGASLVPAKIGRSEPYLRRSGAQVIDEPLDNDMRSGASKRIYKLAEDNNVQAYFAHDYDILELATQTKKRFDAPLFFIAQEIKLNMSYFARRKLQKQLLDVDHIICVSHYVRNFFITEFNIPEEMTTVIYEGFDLSSISSQIVSQERTMSLAHSWGAVENVSELVLVPAFYNDPVWVDNLAGFAREVAQNTEADIRYIVIGDDDGSGAMERTQTSIYRIAPAHVQLAGHCADMEAAIKLTSTVLYLYSRQNSQFSDALIAQALGRFVFLPDDCPASGEFIDVNITGRLLPTDPQTIRESVEDFVRNEQNLRDGNFVASRSFIMKYFSSERMHKHLLALFEDSSF